MPRKKKQKIKVNDVESLEGLLQETYNEACGNINSAQKEINKLEGAAEPQDTDDYTKMAKEKGNLLKIKESSMRIKLEVAKLQHDSIKHNGDIQKATESYSGGKTDEATLKGIREMIMQKKAKKSED
jgi:hypothetical protein